MHDCYAGYALACLNPYIYSECTGNDIANCRPGIQIRLIMHRSKL